MPHKEADIGSETLFRLASQVTHQPLGIECVLGRHAVSHNSVVEGLALSGIEAQDLDIATHASQQGGQRLVVLLIVSMSATASSAGPAALTKGVGCRPALYLYLASYAAACVIKMSLCKDVIAAVE